MSHELELGAIHPDRTQDERNYIEAFRAMARDKALKIRSATDLAGKLQLERTQAWRVLQCRDQTSLPSVDHAKALWRKLGKPPYSEQEIEALARKAFRARTERRIRERAAKSQAASAASGAPSSAGNSKPGSNSSLPVQAGEVDRQRAPNPSQFVERAEALRADPPALLSIVRIAADALTPREAAAALHLLSKDQHDAAADPFLKIYATAREHSTIMQTAVVLLDEFSMNEVASSMLRVALKTHAGKQG